MWLVTQHGFFNIIQYDEDKPDLLTIKARRREDLVWATDELKLMGAPAGPIETYELADYAYRIKAPKDDVMNLVAKMASSVDYDKFKGRIIEVQPDRHAIYLRVWQELYVLQETEFEDGA